MPMVAVLLALYTENARLTSEDSSPDVKRGIQVQLLSATNYITLKLTTFVFLPST